MSKKTPETKLRAARRAKNMRQEDLADAAGVSQSTIVRLESGQNEPTFATALCIARALGVSPLDLWDTEPATAEAA